MMSDNTIRRLAQKLNAQATCLEGYAESHGFESKPVPSVFHSQASHFRDIAREMLEHLGNK